jgi:hypothetical protein
VIVKDSPILIPGPWLNPVLNEKLAIAKKASALAFIRILPLFPRKTAIQIYEPITGPSVIDDVATCHGKKMFAPACYVHLHLSAGSQNFSETD